MISNGQSSQKNAGKCVVIIFKAQQGVFFCRLLKYFRSQSNKQCKPRSEEQSDLAPHWLYLYLTLLNNVRIFAADNKSRQNFQMNFAGVLRDNLAKNVTYFDINLCYYSYMWKVTEDVA